MNNKKISHPGNQLAVFAKYPLSGYVKTRLAASMGKERATRIYRRMLETLLDDLGRARGFDTSIFYAPKGYKRKFRLWQGDRFRFYLQRGDDLGQRLDNAGRLLAGAGADRIIFIGADCPAVTGKLVRKAFEQLDTHDTVIGPSFDGGYYLLGMKKPRAELFEGIPWSSDSVFKRTVEKMEQLKLSYHTLKKLHDVDSEEDLKYLPWEKQRQYDSGLSM